MGDGVGDGFGVVGRGVASFYGSVPQWVWCKPRAISGFLPSPKHNGKPNAEASASESEAEASDCRVARGS